MGWKRKTRFWRLAGAFLETAPGRATLELTRGAVNRAAGVFTTPDLRREIPFTPLGAPLPECTVAVVATAGLHLATDVPFDVDADDGDPSFRVLPSNLDPADLRVAHTHFPHRYFHEDPEVLLPLARLRELERAGMMRLAPRFYSFGFGGTLTRAYTDPKRGTAHLLARELEHDGVDAVLLVPA